MHKGIFQCRLLPGNFQGFLRKSSFWWDKFLYWCPSTSPRATYLVKHFALFSYFKKHISQYWTTCALLSNIFLLLFCCSYTMFQASMIFNHVLTFWNLVPCVNYAVIISLKYSHWYANYVFKCRHTNLLGTFVHIEKPILSSQRSKPDHNTRVLISP